MQLVIAASAIGVTACGPSAAQRALDADLARAAQPTTRVAVRRQAPPPRAILAAADRGAPTRDALAPHSLVEPHDAALGAEDELDVPTPRRVQPVAATPASTADAPDVLPDVVTDPPEHMARDVVINARDVARGSVAEARHAVIEKVREQTYRGMRSILKTSP